MATLFICASLLGPNKATPTVKAAGDYCDQVGTMCIEQSASIFISCRLMGGTYAYCTQEQFEWVNWCLGSHSCPIIH